MVTIAQSSVASRCFKVVWQGDLWKTDSLASFLLFWRVSQLSVDSVLVTLDSLE